MFATLSIFCEIRSSRLFNTREVMIVPANRTKVLTINVVVMKVTSDLAFRRDKISQSVSCILTIEDLYCQKFSVVVKLL